MGGWVGFIWSQLFVCLLLMFAGVLLWGSDCLFYQWGLALVAAVADLLCFYVWGRCSYGASYVCVVV